MNFIIYSNFFDDRYADRLHEKMITTKNIVVAPSKFMVSILITHKNHGRNIVRRSLRIIVLILMIPENQPYNFVVALQNAFMTIIVITFRWKLKKKIPNGRELQLWIPDDCFQWFFQYTRHHSDINIIDLSIISHGITLYYTVYCLSLNYHTFAVKGFEPW